MTAREFLDRFVHPRVAAVALGGATLWGLSFLVAAVGVAVRGRDPLLGATLFAASGAVGLLGTVVLAGCGAYLLGVRGRQILRER